MTDLSPTSAITDILWLQARFKGILDLAEKLQDISNLENYSAELAVSTNSLKAENAKLLGVKLDLEAAVSAAKADAEAVAAAAKAEAAKILSDAKAAVEAARVAGREALANEVQELGNQKAKKVAELADIESQAEAARQEVVNQTAQYEALANLIAEMKAKF